MIEETINKLKQEVEFLRFRGDKLKNVLGNYVADCMCETDGRCNLCRLAIKVIKEWETEGESE